MHQMTLTKTDKENRELWICHECGRAMILSWPPNYSKNVVSEGDTTVQHSGGKGGLQVDEVHVEPWPNADLDWLNDMDRDWLKLVGIGDQD